MSHFKGACAKNLGWGGDLGLGAGEVSGESVEDDGGGRSRRPAGMRESGIGNKLRGEIIGEYMKDCV